MRVDQQWPELLGILFTLSNSKEAGQRENAYRIFATTPGIIEKQHEDTVLSAFTRGFKDEDVTVSNQLPSDREHQTDRNKGPPSSYGGLCFIFPNH
jgi:hypothetical protein